MADDRKNIYKTAAQRYRLAMLHRVTITLKHLGQVEIRCHELGKLRLPSGDVVGCDPLTMFEGTAFDRRIPPGDYPVILSTIRRLILPDERIAVAILQIEAVLPVTWSLATKPGQDMSALQEGYFYGYGVDSGTGSFMSSEAATLMEQRAREDDDYLESVDALLEQSSAAPWIAKMVELDVQTGLNAAMFSSGFGDGAYPSYWGHAANGQVVCLMTDFGLLTA